MSIISSSGSPRHTYRGHRRQSFHPIDAQETTELRARMRTDAAYARTALGMLSYSVVVLKIFDRRFYRIGLLYVVLSAALWLCGFYRRRRWRHDFADAHKGEEPSPRWDDPHLHPASPTSPTVPVGGRVFGAPFLTAGWEVIIVTAIVGAMEIVLLVLLLGI